MFRNKDGSLSARYVCNLDPMGKKQQGQESPEHAVPYDTENTHTVYYFDPIQKHMPRQSTDCYQTKKSAEFFRMLRCFLLQGS